MTTETLIQDIDALLKGEVSGPEQVKAVLREARAEIERLNSIAMGRQAAVANAHLLTQWTNRAIDNVLTMPVVRIERHTVPTDKDPTHD